MKARRTLSVVLSFLAGIAVATIGPWLIRTGVGRLFPLHYEEIARATSPDGTVDAVLEGNDCGAPCSAGYSVSVVPKGSPPLKDPVQQVFIADDMVNPQIRWDELHLLDITYDKAYIWSFHNITYPFGRPGDRASWKKYVVEIRLTPSSPRFSYLAEGNRTRTEK